MTVQEILQSKPKDELSFSLEVLPPLKGSTPKTLVSTLAPFFDLNPKFINLTAHNSEPVYKSVDETSYTKTMLRRRPGTVAVASTLSHLTDTPIIPHVIAAGLSKEQLEYQLIDLQYLGLTNIFVVRGDKSPEDKMFKPAPGGHLDATSLLAQISKFNSGIFVDEDTFTPPEIKFDCGVACYPERHLESPNISWDIEVLLHKQKAGAKYAITQLFYDTDKFIEFVSEAQSRGVTIPIIPGLKPLTSKNQIRTIVAAFNCTIPEKLSEPMMLAQTKEAQEEIGINWTMKQVEELSLKGFKHFHFFTSRTATAVLSVVRNYFT